MKYQRCAYLDYAHGVALRGRAWIEMIAKPHFPHVASVALRGRAWIEIKSMISCGFAIPRRPPREGVD